MPTFSWATEPGALYTILIEDNNLSTRPDSQFGHLMVVNIPGKPLVRHYYTLCLIWTRTLNKKKVENSISCCLVKSMTLMQNIRSMLFLI